MGFCSALNEPAPFPIKYLNKQYSYFLVAFYIFDYLLHELIGSYDLHMAVKL